MKRLRKALRILAVVLFWVLVWELAAWKVGNQLLFPSPRTVLITLWGLIKTSAFWLVTAQSLWNVLSGILCALITGILLAFLTHKVTLLRDLLLPLMTVIKATPVASFIVLLLIWLGSSKVPGIITFLIVLPIIWTNLDEGLRRQDPRLLQVAQVYAMPWYRRLKCLTLPSISPYFLSACRSGLGLAWKAGIAAEIIAMPRNSIGTMLGNAKQYLNTEEMFAWTLTVILLSLLFEWGFAALFRLPAKRIPQEQEEPGC